MYSVFHVSLTDFERKLAVLFNISSTTLSDFASDFINHLKANHNADSNARISGRTVWKAVDEKLKGCDNTRFRKMFKPKFDYSITEIEDGMKLGKFQSECKLYGENDL